MKSIVAPLSYQGFRRPGGAVDRRVLTADFDAGLGLITCERVMFDQAAKLKPSVRSGTWQWMDSPKDKTTKERLTNQVQV